MKTVIREFLLFSRTDQRGVMALSIILVIVIGIRFYLNSLPPGEIKIDPNEMQAIQQWIALQQKNDSLQEIEKPYSSSNNRTLIISKPFDPNKANKVDWIGIGFSEKEASSIIKFRSICKGFRYKEDVQKIFCMTEERYQSLEPFLTIPSKPLYDKHVNGYKKEYTQTRFKMLELNTADSIELISLKGIGPGWARRIIKRRNQLGGYYSISQLLEIKGLSDSLLNTIQTQINIDTSLITRLNINTISLEEIQKHPYCWYGVGKSIVNYRLQHGPYKSILELKKIYTLRPEMYDKLVHYVKLE